MYALIFAALVGSVLAASERATTDNLVQCNIEQDAARREACVSAEQAREQFDARHPFDSRLIECTKIAAEAERRACARAVPRTAWVWETRVDAMTDVVTCVVKPRFEHHRANPVYFYFRSDGADFASVLGDLYPGRPVLVRVDKNPAIDSGDSEVIGGAKLRQLIAQIAGGERILAQHVDWPWGVPRDWSAPVADLGFAITKCREIARAAR